MRVSDTCDSCQITEKLDIYIFKRQKCKCSTLALKMHIKYVSVKIVNASTYVLLDLSGKAYADLANKIHTKYCIKK